MINRKAIIIMLGRIFRETCFPESTDDVSQSSKKITFDFVEETVCQTAVRVFHSMSSVSYTLFNNLLKDRRRKKQYVSSCKYILCVGFKDV